MIEQLNELGIEDLKNQIERYKSGGKIPKGESGIHIKKSHEGLFTKKAKSKGKGVQEYASQVLANKENYSPSTVKQANFARNSTKFSH